MAHITKIEIVRTVDEDVELDQPRVLDTILIRSMKDAASGIVLHIASTGSGDKVRTRSFTSTGPQETIWQVTVRAMRALQIGGLR